jgi:hypothetical protein
MPWHHNRTSSTECAGARMVLAAKCAVQFNSNNANWMERRTTSYHHAMATGIAVRATCSPAAAQAFFMSLWASSGGLGRIARSEPADSCTGTSAARYAHVFVQEGQVKHVVWRELTGIQRQSMCARSGYTAQSACCVMNLGLHPVLI